MYQSLNATEQKSSIYHLIHRGSEQFNKIICILLSSSVLKCIVTIPVLLVVDIADAPSFSVPNSIYYLSILDIVIFLAYVIVLEIVYPSLLLAMYIKDINPTPLQSIIEQYKHVLIEYCIDNTLKTSHQQQRIFAVNYYLKCAFHLDGNPVDTFKDSVKAESNAICESHMTGFKYHHQFKPSTKTSKTVLFNQLCYYGSFVVQTLYLLWVLWDGLSSTQCNIL